MALPPIDMHSLVEALHELAQRLESAQGVLLQGEALHDYRVALRRLAAITPLLNAGIGGVEIMGIIKKELSQSNSLRDQDVLLTYLTRQMPELVCQASMAQSGYQISNKRLHLVLNSVVHWLPPVSKLEQSNFAVRYSLLQLRSWTLLRERLMQLERLLAGSSSASETVIKSAHRLRIAIKGTRYLLEWQETFARSALSVWPELRLWQDKLGYASDRWMIVSWLQQHDWQEHALRMGSELTQWQRQLPEWLPSLRHGCNYQLQLSSGTSLSGYFFH